MRAWPGPRARSQLALAAAQAAAGRCSAQRTSQPCDSGSVRDANYAAARGGGGASCGRRVRQRADPAPVLRSSDRWALRRLPVVPRLPSQTANGVDELGDLQVRRQV
jgi:hypothetical protein